ncbi:MAG: pSer/pThr/pTyr-binding forkhead associated (FHA) protein [Bacteriovoracaceae bacterium]
MNISVFKDNQSVIEVNLGSEVIGNLESDATFFLGRSPDCHVHLDDKQISREHAEVSFISGAWNIKQLSPFSKVIVNGTPYENKVLESGDIITVGPYVLNVNIPKLVVTETPELEASESVEEVNEVDEGAELSDETELLDDFDEETVALDSQEVSELGDEAVDEEFSEDAAEDFGEEDFESSDDDFSSEDESFESDVSEMGEDSDEDELFGDSDDSETSFEDNNDDDYAIDSFDDDEDGDESTRVIQAFAKIELELFGEHAPYEKYVIDTAEVRIGRDPEKCQIVLNDPEVSGVHAILKKNNITCFIEDQDSGNGTLLNGERINKSVLTNNDEIVIGGTTLTVKISSDFLQDEQQRLMPVEENQMVEVEEIVEVDADFEGELGEIAEGTTESQGLVADLKNFKNLPPELRKKYLIYGVVLFVLGLVLFSGDEPKKKKVKKETVKSNLLDNKKDDPNSKKKKLLKKLTPEQTEYVEAQYLLAKEQFEVGNYRDAVTEFDKIFVLIEDYKSAGQLYQLSKDGLKKLEEQEKKRKEEIAKKLRDEKVKTLVAVAREAVDNNQAIRARSTFDTILSLDPENFDVPILKQRIEEYERKQQAAALKKAEAEAERQRQVELLSPGKNFYLNKEWYKAIQKLKDFVRKRNIDEDLMTEGSNMLSESKDKLNNIVGPLLGKARSLKEGQDLKGAYEIYIEIMSSDPSNAEALDESNEIRERLKNRSKKIYREAIIAESLSLFEDAKEKFQEVQQVSPSDSEYYKKASEKLKDYLD